MQGPRRERTSTARKSIVTAARTWPHICSPVGNRTAPSCTARGQRTQSWTCRPNTWIQFPEITYDAGDAPAKPRVTSNADGNLVTQSSAGDADGDVDFFAIDAPVAAPASPHRAAGHHAQDRKIRPIRVDLLRMPLD